MALPQPNPRIFENYPLPYPLRERDDGGDTVQHDQSDDITGDDILDLTNHVRNFSSDRAFPVDNIRPD